MQSLASRFVASFLLFASTACRAASAPPSYRAMVYTQAFSERFKLPAGGVQTLDAGVHAIVYRIIERGGQPPRCLLDLYLDEKLNLDFPTGEQGFQHYDDDRNPLFFVQSNADMPTESHRWDRIQGNFHSVRCRETREGCAVQGDAPVAYFRQLLPGVALQTYDILCTQLDPKDGPNEMWLLLAGQDPSVLEVTKSDGTGTFQLRIPQQLLEHAADRTRQAIQVYARALPPVPKTGEFSVPRGQ